MTLTTTTASRGRWSCPDAKLVLRADAPRSEWLNTRRMGIGGSDASTVADLNPWSSRYELWLDKTGRWHDDRDNDAMEWGRRLEPVIAEWFTDRTGLDVRRAGLMQSREHPHLLANVDRLVEDGWNLEIKSTNWRQAHEWEDDQVPDHAELQTQHYLAVTGRPGSWVVVLIDGRTPLLRRVERNDDLIATLMELETRFWVDHVLADVPPPVDGSDATIAAVKALHGAATVLPDPVEVDAGVVEALVANRDLAIAKAREAEAERNQAEAQLRLLLGDHISLRVDGFDRVTCKPNGTFAASRFAKDHPELAERFSVPSTALDTKALAAAEPDLFAQYRARVLRVANPPKEK